MANGYLLHETDAYAVIATLESENEKTGNMIQLWILVRDKTPHRHCGMVGITSCASIASIKAPMGLKTGHAM